MPQTTANPPKHQRLLQDRRASAELVERFVDPGPEFGPLPLWWWSGDTLTSERLRWQMEQMVAQEMRQAVVICLAPSGPLYGAQADDPPFLSPAWLELLDQACADAAELGFTLWMYDQIGFSGANFQGQLIAKEPSFAGLGLYRTIGAPGTVTCPDGHTELHRDVTSEDETLIHAGPRGFDYFNPEAGAALLDSVHGVLARHVGKWFGTSIGGFFQDEMPGMPTWGRDFAATFRNSYGYDLVPRLASLYEGEDAEAARVRQHYHEHRARLARRGFFDPQDAWYEEHGLICGFDQQSPAREGDSTGGVALYGDYLGTHSGYGAPGSDHWGDAKVHSSLAHANGQPRTWIEAFHSSGWGGTLEETYDWLSPFLRRGATLYDPHAVYYSTHGGWWEWAAPSTCWRQPYWPSYHVFATAVARLCSVLSAGTHLCDTVLMAPTSTSQAYTTLAGPQPAAQTASGAYHELNGISLWFAEDPGVLDRAGIDYDVLDENTIGRGSVSAAGLTVGAETYRTVVVPSAQVLQSQAARELVELAATGGRVICVGEAPRLIVGGADDGGFVAAVERGDITVVPKAVDVPSAVLTGSVRVQADAPYVLRQVGDVHVLMLIAHDDTSGTAQPMVDLDNPRWWQAGGAWGQFWDQLVNRGYDFRPAGDRVARVQIKGLDDGVTVQQWDPRTGARAPLELRDGTLEVPFADGPMALVVLGNELPGPDQRPLGTPAESVDVDGPWTAHAESTLNNDWGDLAALSRSGTLPIEVWRLEHRVAGDEQWHEAVASFGPFAEVRAGSGEWKRAEWSLSRGIRNDPLHFGTLGPKGLVPEEFLDWRKVSAGERVSVRTHLSVAEDRPAWLAVGANSARSVTIDGAAVAVEGSGYQTLSPLPSGGDVQVEIEFVADTDGPLRASFAVVVDPEKYRRPEWIVPEGEVRRGRVSELRREVTLTAVPDRAVVQLASEGPCSLVVNGQEVGRQSDFGPYPDAPDRRVQPYDVTRYLVEGKNEVVLRTLDAFDIPTVAALDSTGLNGLVSDDSWEGAQRMRRLVNRSWCLTARAHSLPSTDWLSESPDGVVVPVVPDVLRAGERTEFLRVLAPLGTVEMTVPTSLAFEAVIDGARYAPDDGRLRFAAPLAAGTTVELEVSAVDGRSGGALLDGPIEVVVEPAEAPLVSWEELGLGALGGQVSYRTTVEVSGGKGRSVLDLGDVRGTADVIVNGNLTDQLVWGPWRSDITDALVDGSNTIEIVVRGTLAGYLSEASPTSTIGANQIRTGLFGPVRLLRFASG